MSETTSEAIETTKSVDETSFPKMIGYGLLIGFELGMIVVFLGIIYLVINAWFFS